MNYRKSASHTKVIPIHHEVLLVIDAVTGQNGLQQAKVFKVVNVTGIVLTKLDGTAKGGSHCDAKELGIPIKFIGAGESVEDLKPFVAVILDALMLGDEVECLICGIRNTNVLSVVRP